MANSTTDITGVTLRTALAAAALVAVIAVAVDIELAFLSPWPISLP